jgi:hypothetical protein
LVKERFLFFSVLGFCSSGEGSCILKLFALV